MRTELGFFRDTELKFISMPFIWICLFNTVFNLPFGVMNCNSQKDFLQVLMLFMEAQKMNFIGIRDFFTLFCL